MSVSASPLETHRRSQFSQARRPWPRRRRDGHRLGRCRRRDGRRRAIRRHLLWAIAVGAFFKYVLNEGIARWQLATGRTALEGWAEYLPAWVKWYFGVYLVLWTVAVTAALTNATGLGIENLTGGRIPQSWGAVFHSVFGFVFVLLGGYGGFEKMMKTLVGVMGFSILICSALTFHDPAGVLSGAFIPTIPGGAGLYVLSIIGGIGGSITMLSYNYWMREEKISGAEQLGYVRGDIAIAYLFTALFGMAIMMTANQAFYVPASPSPNAQAVPKMAEMLGSILGAFGRLRIRSDSGPPCSRRSSACGRACRICMPTSTASSRSCRRKSGAR
jgi:Mn2+/Fe2+ NRAMP family transporter